MTGKLEKHGLRTVPAILLGLLAALLLELLLFNWKALFTLGKTWTPLPEPERIGRLAEEKRLCLSFRDLDREIDWCHLEIEVRDSEGRLLPTDLLLRISDEGSAELYEIGTVRYLPGHDKGAWFPLHAYGRVRQLTVELTTETPGCVCTVRAAEYNGCVPFRLSLLRIAGLWALLILLWLLRPGSALYDNRLWNRRPWAKALCVTLVLLLNVALLGRLTQLDRRYMRLPEGSYSHQQYARLAQALAEGRVWIDTDRDQAALELLGQLENPYDPAARQALFQGRDFKYAWDTAYYNGHYYVYFGVVPVLLSYLPWYLLTGTPLPTAYVVFLADVLVVLGAFLFLRALIRRYFPQTSFPVYLLLSLLLGNCTGPLCFALEPSFYVLPLLFSQAFVLFGMALWLSAAEHWALALGTDPGGPEREAFCFAPCRSGPQPRRVTPRIAAGALLCALTAGCRPQLLVFSALALPIFWPLARREPKGALAARRALAIVLPYAAVALPLMCYNELRFGSPFDFGANYNLTTNDMTHRGFRLARLPDGLFAYLFRLPDLELSFPYIQEAVTPAVYMGKTIREPMFGGVLPLFPFLWILLGTRRASPLLRAKKLRGLVLLPLLLALLVVIADTEMAGILWRYTGDFLALLFVSAGVVYLALLQTAGARRRRSLLGFLTAAVLLALAVCLLISVSYSDLLSRDPENYFRLKDLLSVF